MRRDARAFLFDVQQAASLLDGFVAGRGFADYERDAMLRAAVERQFEIIGEALAQLSRRNPALASQITGYQQVIAFRNILIHGYAGIDNHMVWTVLENEHRGATSRRCPVDQ